MLRRQAGIAVSSFGNQDQHFFQPWESSGIIAERTWVRAREAMHVDRIPLWKTVLQPGSKREARAVGEGGLGAVTA